MLQILFLLSANLQQETPPQAKTVEQRLEELDRKLSTLERKRKDLDQENSDLERKLADRKAQIEKSMRMSAEMLTQMYVRSAQLSEQQADDLRETWYGWLKEDDRNKPMGHERWIEREAALKSKLKAEQLSNLARKMREDQISSAKANLSFITTNAKLSREKAEALEKAVLAKMTFEDGIVIAYAHPQAMANAWGQTLAALESSLPELSSTWTEAELQAMRKLLDQWKPKQR